ncbi:hypothetical protein Tco_0367617 [Tanacetum coccineum]
MERKQGTAHYNNWQANKQWNKNKVNVENVGGSSQEKAFEEEFPKLPIRNDKKKAVDCIHDKERQKNKFSMLTDVEDDIEEIKIMKDKMIVDQQEDTTKIENGCRIVVGWDSSKVDDVSCVEGIFTEKLSNEDAFMMIREVTNEEVEKSVFDIGENKALGLDSSFFKKHDIW